MVPPLYTSSASYPAFLANRDPVGVKCLYTVKTRSAAGHSYCFCGKFSGAAPQKSLPERSATPTRGSDQMKTSIPHLGVLSTKRVRIYFRARPNFFLTLPLPKNGRGSDGENFFRSLCVRLCSATCIHATRSMAQFTLINMGIFAGFSTGPALKNANQRTQRRRRRLPVILKRQPSSWRVPSRRVMGPKRRSS